MKKVIVTSALPYVNNVPHLGTMVCVISAHIYQAYLKLKEVDVISVLGTDEHGTTAETKALEENTTPKEIVDRYFKIHKEIYEWFECHYDCFGRASSKENWEISQDIFTKLDQNNFIIEDQIQQAYCEKDKLFLADRFVYGICPNCEFEDARGDQCDNCGQLLNTNELISPKCKLCKNTPQFKKTKHLFIDLPKLTPDLEKWINKVKQDWTPNARTTTEAWLKEGLKNRCITRDLKWGIKVPKPGFEDKVFYSWFDAPIAYIGITKECKENWYTYWKDPKTELVQFMGKDNIPFHTILFPSFLIGAKDNYTLLDRISVNEYLNYENLKFSKSRGTGVFGDDAMNSGIPAIYYRFYIAINRPEKGDTEFTWKDFQQKINTELVDNFGNLINRTLTFIKNQYNNQVPASDNTLNYKDDIKEIEQAYEEAELKKALKQILSLSRKGNQYFQEKEPWKSKESPEAQAALGNLFILIKDLSILIQPFLPSVTKQIEEQIGATNLKWKHLQQPLENPQLQNIKPLFKKLEDNQITELRERFSGKQTKKGFNLLNLKVAEILTVRNHPNAEKLLLLEINAGEPRQLLAGLKGFYKPEELIRKKIIIVSNLEPKKLRGELSQGMLLAAEQNKDIGVLFVENAEPGTPVTIEGATPNPNQITFEEFLSVDLQAKDNAAFFNNNQLKAGDEPVQVDKNLKGKIR